MSNKDKQQKHKESNELTNVVSFIKDNCRLLWEFFGDLFCNLGIQEVVIAVHDDVGMSYLE